MKNAPFREKKNLRPLDKYTQFRFFSETHRWFFIFQVLTKVRFVVFYKTGPISGRSQKLGTFPILSLSLSLTLTFLIRFLLYIYIYIYIYGTGIRYAYQTFWSNEKYPLWGFGKIRKSVKMGSKTSKMCPKNVRFWTDLKMSLMIIFKMLWFDLI